MRINLSSGVFVAMLLTAPLLSDAAIIFGGFTDVAADAWYRESVQSLAENGTLDTSHTLFRPGDPATRAEFVKLVVMMNGGLLSALPSSPTFADVTPAAWHFPYMEEAAREWWVKGEDNCAVEKSGRLCRAHPDSQITRAEAAALIVRAFALEKTGLATPFADNPAGTWYADILQTAADNCALEGDAVTGLARPLDPINRAEMAVMLHRIDTALTEGVGCEAGSQKLLEEDQSSSQSSQN